MGAVLGTVLFLALAASPALAFRPFESQITGPPADAPIPGAFVSPGPVAVDSDDNVLIGDPGKHYGPGQDEGGVISKFDSAGNYLSQQDGDGHFLLYLGSSYLSTISVSASTGNLYAGDPGNGVVDVFDSSGAYTSQLNAGVCQCGFFFVAADQSNGATAGSVYIAGGGLVTKLNSSGSQANFTGLGSYINGSQIVGVPAHGSVPAHSFGGLNAIATDVHGNIFVADLGSGEIDEFDSSGVFVMAIDGAAGGAIALDPTNGHILVANGNAVYEYDATGNLLTTITGTDTDADPVTGGDPAKAFSGGVGGIAVDSTGKLYVSDGAHAAVDVLGPDLPLPAVSYSPASNLTRTSATLSANADPGTGGDIVGCHFDYGTTSSYGSSAPCTPDPGASNFSAPTPVSSDLTNLDAETTYHYRVVVSNANGTEWGGDQTFTTMPAVQQLSTDAPTNVTETTATLNGSFNGDGSDTQYYFEWGADTSYGNLTAAAPGADGGSPTGPTTVSADISGLQVYTPISPTYHYRIVATNSLGTTVGPDRSFNSAPPSLPQVSNVEASGVTPSTATLGASINPELGDTVYFFQYGTSSDYGSNTAISDSIGSDGVDHGVSTALSGLAPGNTYHFRVVAINFGGTTHGSDQTFSTPDVPRLDNASASGVTEHEATLTAQLDPNSKATTFHVEYGPTSAYGQRTPESATIGSDAVDHVVTTALSGLSAGTTYHFRVVSTNAIGTANGPDQIFTTSSPPVVNQVPPPGCRAGTVKRNGKCVATRHKRKHHKHKRRSQHRH